MPTSPARRMGVVRGKVQNRPGQDPVTKALRAFADREVRGAKKVGGFIKGAAGKVMDRFESGFKVVNEANRARNMKAKASGDSYNGRRGR